MLSIGGRGEVADDLGLVRERHGPRRIQAAADPLTATAAAVGRVEGDQDVGEGGRAGVVDAAALAIAAPGAADGLVAQIALSVTVECRARTVLHPPPSPEPLVAPLDAAPPVATLPAMLLLVIVRMPIRSGSRRPSPGPAWPPAMASEPPVALLPRKLESVTVAVARGN